MDCDPLQGTIKETLPPVPWSAWREVLWQNWLVKVFEIHFHCVGRLDALPFPQLTWGGGGWGEDGATTDKQAPGLPCTLLDPWTSLPPDFQKGGAQEDNSPTCQSLGGVGIRQGMVRSWTQSSSLERSRIWTAEREWRWLKSGTLRWRGAWVCLLWPLPFFPRTCCWRLITDVHSFLSVLVLYTLVPSKLSTPKCVD